jgi:hypothetical protein
MDVGMETNGAGFICSHVQACLISHTAAVVIDYS